jgi:nicotinamide phosphoribosyltransferase
MTLKGEEGELENEKSFNIIPNRFVACVSDSYNIFRACSEYWGKLRFDFI